MCGNTAGNQGSHREGNVPEVPLQSLMKVFGTVASISSVWKKNQGQSNLMLTLKVSQLMWWWASSRFGDFCVS